MRLETIKKIRKPLPHRPSRPQGTPKGKHGYDRKREKQKHLKEES